MMNPLRRTFAVAAAVAALSSTLVVAYAAHADWDSDPMNFNVVTDQHYLCGGDDLQEGDIQGDVPSADQTVRDPQTGKTRAEQGYNCGLEYVGHNSLTEGGRPATGNANMAWADHCAYVAGPGGGIVPNKYDAPAPVNGVAVVDVSVPANPVHVGTLHGPEPRGANATSETINAVTTPERSILVVGRYGNNVAKTENGSEPMDVYDVTDCAHPVLMTTYDWPANIHNLTLSPDGKYVFATIPLQAVDISGLWDGDASTGVTYLGSIQDALDGPPLATGPVADGTDVLVQNMPEPAEGKTVHPQNMSHEAWPAPDFATNTEHKYLYVGGQTPQYEMFTIIDLKDWLQRDADGKPVGPPHVESEQSGRGHSVRTATINGTPYVLHSEESVFGTAYGCVPESANPFAGPAQPWLTDISDPAHPRTVSQFGLEINDPRNCQEQTNSKANQSVHYHDVDNQNDTSFVIASMLNGGIRVFDVTDPARPQEVAYFNPGDRDPSDSVLLDKTWAHSRYVPETHDIWFASGNGGFWVVHLEDQVREYLEARHAAHGAAVPDPPITDPGHPGTMGASMPLLPVGVDIAPYYCTLAATLPS